MCAMIKRSGLPLFRIQLTTTDLSLNEECPMTNFALNCLSGAAKTVKMHLLLRIFLLIMAIFFSLLGNVAISPWIQIKFPYASFPPNSVIICYSLSPGFTHEFAAEQIDSA
eukprot:TRINITY_DN7265_c0_g1_i1.p1 TRINITY_DN7265_c0_g1~~TRINITY_DN7265_c0_g1_i1.p1  ORF type:complete len:111 (-),score=0.51 TRINITY_DN7265_c0_g1_i1:51-383(-)